MTTFTESITANTIAYIEYKDYHLAIPVAAKVGLLRSVTLVDPIADKILDTKIVRALLINPYSMHFNKTKIFHEWTENDFIDFIEILATIFSDPYLKLYIPSVVIEFWTISTEKYILLYNTVVSQVGKTLDADALGHLVTDFLRDRNICDYEYIKDIPGERLFMFQKKLYVLGLDNIVRIGLAGPGVMLSWSPLRSTSQNNELRDYGRMAARDSWHEFLMEHMDIFRRNCSWPDVVIDRLVRLSHADFATILAGTYLPIDRFTWQ